MPWRLRWRLVSGCRQQNRVPAISASRDCESSEYIGLVIEVIIDVPLGGFVNRTDDGAIDFVSPAPCPFNYGSVPDTISGDGVWLVAVVLGLRLACGLLVLVFVVVWVCFF